ncbi:hypothetical protein V6N12_065470 [Hibiscus sabdariffa]|uniref:DNA-directed RNA polymerase n=1 Tax=Hibiscus sabdariffa TaxID=183260 RepID=A0ABR2G941_9ROSI
MRCFPLADRYEIGLVVDHIFRCCWWSGKRCSGCWMTSMGLFYPFCDYHLIVLLRCGWWFDLADFGKNILFVNCDLIMREFRRLLHWQLVDSRKSKLDGVRRPKSGIVLTKKGVIAGDALVQSHEEGVMDVRPMQPMVAVGDRSKGNVVTFSKATNSKRTHN